MQQHKDRWLAKHSTGHAIKVHVVKDKKTGKLKRKTSSGLTVPKSRKTYKTKTEAKKHLH